MTALTLLTVFLGGLLGSTHCLAMCGGIATATGVGTGSPARAWLYQAGRLTSYTAAGAAAGQFGVVAGANLSHAHGVLWLRVLAALVVVLIGLDLSFSGMMRSRWLRAPERAGAWLWRHVAPQAQGWLPQQPLLRAYALGLLWGWLPCGLVYSSLVAAAVSGSAVHGMATMVAFGAGTVPAMYGLSRLGSRLPRRDGTFARVSGTVLVACGLWMAAIPVAILRTPVGPDEALSPVHCSLPQIVLAGSRPSRTP